MRAVSARRIKAPRKCYYVALIETKPRMEELPDNEKVVVLARRDLIMLQRYLPKSCPMKRRVTKLLDAL
jgi:hypothetical protein